MRKSDVLFLIIGTNPMPNIISIVNRVKDDGKVYLVYSREEDGMFSTQKITSNLRSIFNEKYKNMSMDVIEVNKLSESNMKSEIESRMQSLCNISNKKITIELNYTGGTKLMASTIYGYFKEILRKGENDIILSYLDCEKDIFVYEEMKEGILFNSEENIEEKELCKKVSLKEIINSHRLNYDKDRVGVEFPEISLELFSNFETLSIEGKYKWINDLNIIFTNKDKAIKKDLLINFVEEYVIKADTKGLQELSLKKLIPYIVGDSLEEYIYVILQSLRDEKKIDDFRWSVIQDATDEMSGIEVDFVLIKGNNTFLLSVTLCEEKAKCRLKLYEAKVRGEQLSGDETRIGFICLYKDSQELEMLIDRNLKYSKNLIIGVNNFTDIKERIDKWINGRREL